MQRVIASSYLTSFNSPSTCFIAPILANFPTTFTNELFCPSSLWLITSINALSTSPNTSTVKQRTCRKQLRNLDNETRSENIANTAITRLHKSNLNSLPRHIPDVYVFFSKQAQHKPVCQRFVIFLNNL